MNKSTEKKYLSVIKRIQKTGYSRAEYLKLPRPIQKKLINYTGKDKNFDGFLNNVKALTYGETEELGLSRAKKFIEAIKPSLFKRKKLSKQEFGQLLSLKKSAGINIFWDLVKKVKKLHHFRTKKKAVKYTRKLLRNFKNGIPAPIYDYVIFDY